MRLVDGIVYSFQEQTTEDQVMLDGFGMVVNALGMFHHFPQQLLLMIILSGVRVKPYLLQIVTTNLWRLNNKSAKVCQQAADLTTRLVVVIKQCGEDQQLRTLRLALGEEYPDTLGSIIAAEGAIANVVGIDANEPVKDLLLRMAPIWHNWHKRVQEASTNLIGCIGKFVEFDSCSLLNDLLPSANRSAKFVPAHEWMCICFELLDPLEAHKKGIHRAAMNSFGCIAKSLGPQDVLLRLCGYNARGRAHGL